MLRKVLDHGFVDLIDVMGGDEAIVQAARVSYGQGSKGVEADTKLITYLIRNGHSSPLEQVVFKWHLKLPIFVMRQLVRHRTARLNEVSARYTELKDEFYIPELERLKGQGKTNKQGSEGELDLVVKQQVLGYMSSASQLAYSYYESLLAMGVSRELARIVLPVNIYTECYWQMDLNNMLKFLKLRLDEHAQWEIVEYAKALAEDVKERVPIAYKAWEDLNG